MALFLVQHGRSLPKEQDPDQGLSPEGRSEVERIAGVAAEHGVRVARIVHSGKKRAEETAWILAAALQPEAGVEGRHGLNPLDEVAELAPGFKSSENLMLVGHLPFMERLAGLLVAGSSDRLVVKFQNGGIVCLDQDPDRGFWFIKWTLMPKIG